jgi:hypothetical protein
MKKIVILGLALALIGGAAYANFCARDFVPAATLLVPYAVVALDANGVPDPNGWDTILDVTNVSSTKQIIHVIIWDALSDGIADFDEVLSGYDVWQINFRDLLNGAFNLFDTGDSDNTDNGSGPKPLANPPYPQIGDFWGTTKVPSDVGTKTSNWAGAGLTGFPTQYGPSSNSQFVYSPGGNPPQLPIPQDIDAEPALDSLGRPVFASNAGCNFPYGPQAVVGSEIVAALQGAIVDLNEWGIVPPESTRNCTGLAVGLPAWLNNTPDNPVFFYVTLDVVTGCNQNFPFDPNYWKAQPPFPSANNVLIGNIFYLSPTGNFSDSIPAVSIEADFDWPGYTGWNGGQQTSGFYSDFTEIPFYQIGVHDWHEPLPTAFAFEYYNGGGITSNVMVWKNTTELSYYLLSGSSTKHWFWDACLPYIYYAWDQNENSLARGGSISGFGTAEPNAFPYQTQKVPLNPANLDGIPAAAGWILLVFDPSLAGSGFPDEDGSYEQAWVGVQYYWGSYSTEVEAAVLGNYWCFSGDVMPALDTNRGVLDGHLNHVHPH